MKRFIVKQVKVVWRNNMIAGNPVVRSFQKFGVYDRNWKDDHFCYCPRPIGEFASSINNRKFRVVVDNENLAKAIATKLEELLQLTPGAKHIDFNGLSNYIEDANEISIKKVEY